MSDRIRNVKEQEWNGIHFRSTLEANTAKTLEAMGLPYRYEDRKIILQDSFRSPFQKEKIRHISYTPDFEIGPLMIECKGFETPEWKIKKKLLFKYLIENEPETIFKQVHDNRKELLLALDPYWQHLGYAIQVTPQPKKKKTTASGASASVLYDSVTQAIDQLNIRGSLYGSIFRSLTGQKEYVCGYNWKLVKLKL